MTWYRHASFSSYEVRLKIYDNDTGDHNPKGITVSSLTFFEKQTS